MNKIGSILESFINEVKNKKGKFYRREGKNKYVRRLYAIDPKLITEKDIKRFFKFVEVVEDENYDIPHLLWTKGWHAKHPKKGMPFSDKKRYGMFSWKGSYKKSIDVRAARFFWVLANNKKIFPGKSLNHLCSHSQCVVHNYIGSAEDNVADRYRPSERPAYKKLQKNRKEIKKLINKYL